MGYPIQIANVTLPLRFPLVLSSDHITGATGITPTVIIAKNDGLGFITPTGAISEVGVGWYSVAANATDASTLGPILLHATGTGCDPSDESFLCVNFDPSVTINQAPTSPTTKTVLRLATEVLQEIHVLQAGEVPSADDSALFLSLFNDFIDSVCALERLMIYTITRSTWTITTGDGSYTVGPSGDVNIVRPVYLDHVNYQDTSVSPTIEMPLWSLSDDDYAALPQRALTGVSPQFAHYNPTFPTGTLSLFPVPTSTTLQGVVYAPTSVTRFGALSDVIALPPGYNRFLRTNMGLECAQAWRDSMPISQALVRAAQESKANVKRVNNRPRDLIVDAMGFGGGGSYDIWSDR